MLHRLTDSKFNLIQSPPHLQHHSSPASWLSLSNSTNICLLDSSGLAAVIFSGQCASKLACRDANTHGRVRIATAASYCDSTARRASVSSGFALSVGRTWSTKSCGSVSAWFAPSPRSRGGDGIVSCVFRFVMIKSGLFL